MRTGKARPGMREGGGGETAALGNRCLQRKGRADWRNLLGRDIFRTGTCSDYTAKAFSVSSLAFDSRYPCGGSHSLPFAVDAFQLSVNPSGDCKNITFTIILDLKCATLYKLYKRYCLICIKFGNALSTCV